MKEEEKAAQKLKQDEWDKVPLLKSLSKKQLDGVFD